ncbi:FecR family protein [soil metagenome]
MHTTVHKQLLFAHFAGQATPLQQRLIEDWLQEPANQEQYYEWLEEWDLQNLQYHPDEDQLFDQLQHQIRQYQQPTTTDKKTPVYFSFRWVAAASVMLACFLATGYLFRQPLFYQTLETAYGEVRQETLPDGSVVTLNAHSSLRLPRFGFGQSSREVFLWGEATFSVRHLPNHQHFVVRTDKHLDVTVLGTEFTVYARTQTAQVVLHKGKVQIDYQQAGRVERLMMRPGDLVKLEKNSRIQRQHLQRSEALRAWQVHEFVFEKTPLLAIARMMEETYGLKVTIQDDVLAARAISGTFKAATADELLMLVTQLLEVNYNRQNNEVLLFE